MSASSFAAGDAENKPGVTTDACSSHMATTVTVSPSVNTPANEVMMTTTCSSLATAMMNSPASGDRQPATVVLIQQRLPPVSSSSSASASSSLPPSQALSSRVLHPSNSGPSLPPQPRYQLPTATFVPHLQYQHQQQQHSDGLETVKQVLDANSDYLSHAANASAHEAAQAAAMLTDDFPPSTASYITSAQYDHVLSTMQTVTAAGGTGGRQTAATKAKRTRQRALSMPAAGDECAAVDGRTAAKVGRPSAAAVSKANRNILYSVNENLMTMAQYGQSVQQQQHHAPSKRSRVSHASISCDASGGAAAAAALMMAEGGGAESFACHICGVTFPSDKYLSMHMPTHNAQNGVGGGGGELTAEKLQQHIERHLPPPAASHQSQSLSSSSSSSSGLLQDARTVTNKQSCNSTTGATWSCKICNKVFAQNSNFKNHMRTHSDERPYVCEVCNIGFKERYHLKKHHLFKHTSELKEKCRVCGKLFKDSTAVRAHERIHSEERPYSCRRCGKSFKTSECLWHHENRSKTCGLAAIAMSLLEGGSGGMGGPAPPPVSAARSSRKSAAAAASSAASHSQQHTAKVYAASNGNSGSQVAVTLPSTAPIQQQQQQQQHPTGAMIAPQQHLIQNLAAATPSELYIGAMPASSSQRSLAVFFPTSAVMGQQGYVQAPRIAIIRPMQPVSASVTASPAQLQQQQQATAVRPMAVNMAEQARMVSIITTPHHLQHPQQQPMAKADAQSFVSMGTAAGYQSNTDKTPDVFSVQRQLQQFAVKPEPIEIVDSEMCCEVDGGDGSMLAAEVEVKTSSPEPVDGGHSGSSSSRKRFACVQCGKRFTTSGACDKHALTHSESRPYKCDECDVGFKLKVHLKKHNLYRHSDDKPCPCTVCGKKFKDSSAVRLHERIHSTQRPFVCECGKTFKTKENLWGHRHRGPCDKMPLAPSSSSSFSGDDINTSSSSMEYFCPDSVHVQQQRMQMSADDGAAVALPAPMLTTASFSIKSENMILSSGQYVECQEAAEGQASSGCLARRSSASTLTNPPGTIQQQQVPTPTIRVVKREATAGTSTVGGNVFIPDGAAAMAGAGKGAVYPKAEQFVTPAVRIVDVGNVTYVSPVQKESALPPFETFAPNVRTAFPALPMSSQEADQQQQQQQMTAVFSSSPAGGAAMAERPSSLSDKCPTIQHLLRNKMNNSEPKAATATGNSSNRLPAIYGIFQPPQLQMAAPGGGSLTPNSPFVFSPSLSPSKSLYAVASSPGGLRPKVGGLGPLSLLALSSPSSPNSSQHGLLTSANPMMPAGVSEISPHTPPPSAAAISGRTQGSAELCSPALSDFSPARTPKGHPSSYAALSQVYAMHVNQDEGGADMPLPIYYWDDEKKHTPLVVWQATPTGVFQEISRSGFNQL